MVSSQPAAAAEEMSVLVSGVLHHEGKTFVRVSFMRGECMPFKLLRHRLLVIDIRRNNVRPGRQHVVACPPVDQPPTANVPCRREFMDRRAVIRCSGG